MHIAEDQIIQDVFEEETQNIVVFLIQFHQLPTVQLARQILTRRVVLCLLMYVCM